MQHDITRPDMPMCSCTELQPHTPYRRQNKLQTADMPTSDMTCKPLKAPNPTDPEQQPPPRVKTPRKVALRPISAMCRIKLLLDVSATMGSGRTMGNQVMVSSRNALMMARQSA